MRKTWIVIIILTIVLGGISMCLFFWKGQSVTLADIEEKLGHDLSKDMRLEYLETFKDYGEDHAEVKLLIKRDLKELQKELEQKYGENRINTKYKYSQYKNRSLWAEIQTGEIEAIYEKMLSGKKAKTIIIDIFIIKDDKDNNYLYIFY